MVKEDIYGAIVSGVSRGHSLKNVMISLYNAGYKRADIEEAARHFQQQRQVQQMPQQSSQSNQPPQQVQVQKTTTKQENLSSNKPLKAPSSQEQNQQSPQPQVKQKVSDYSSAGSGIKHRNPFLVFLFFMITAGIYGFYWYYSTAKELKQNTKSAPNPTWVWFFLIPVANVVFALIFLWKHSKAINKLTGFSAGGMFVLWIFVSPIALILAQIELNKKSSASASQPTKQGGSKKGLIIGIVVAMVVIALVVVGIIFWSDISELIGLS